MSVYHHAVFVENHAVVLPAPPGERHVSSDVSASVAAT